MASFSQEERSRPTAEDVKIILLVNAVRELNDEIAFVELKKLVDSFVKLSGNTYRIPGCDSDEIQAECYFALRFKAIEDFDHTRGKFRSFAILCIRRHLFSLIKGNNQQKRRVLNESLSLDQDRGEEGENLSLINLVAECGDAADEEIVKRESHLSKRDRLLGRLSRLEQEVCKLYLQQYHYEEIVESLQDVFPDRNITKKTIDNSLQRIRQKAQDLAKNMDLEE